MLEKHVLHSKKGVKEQKYHLLYILCLGQHDYFNGLSLKGFDLESLPSNNNNKKKLTQLDNLDCLDLYF